MNFEKNKSKPLKLVVVRGCFDPIHSEHIEYFKLARCLGHKLIVALNSDNWLEKKKGKFFMPFKEREVFINLITYVDEVISFNDDVKSTSINALEKVILA